jgi:hypothetical protein
VSNKIVHNEQMMNEQEFWAALTPIPPNKTQYRLYYDQNGLPLKYSVDEEPGNYIEVTAFEYLKASFKLKVKDEVIVYLKEPAVPKLVISTHGTATHLDDITVLSDSVVNNKWSLKIYEED